MDTTERMMIMGMCLQGLLANPEVYSGGFTSSDPEIAKRGEERAEKQRAYAVKEAHRIVDLLDPSPAKVAAHDVAALTRTAYEVIRAADADGAGQWCSYDAARISVDAEDANRLDGVFERVARWYADGTGFPETVQDRIIAAVVAASRNVDAQQSLFGGHD